MQNPHKNSPSQAGPETSGAALHHASKYDFHTRLLGLGINGPNSKMIIELANIRPGDSVLDVGCGSGNLTLTAQSSAGKGGSVHGIDASPEMIEVAKQKASRLGAEVVFAVGLIEKLAFPDATFDVVVSRLVIHHLPDQLKRRGFQEILRVLKSGGHLLIADFHPPANPVLYRLLSAVFGSPMMQSNVEKVPEMLAEAGFVEVFSGPTRSPFLAFVRGTKPVQRTQT